MPAFFGRVLPAANGGVHGVPEFGYVHDRASFYAAYDSLKCAQQKCLIHLLRDFNQDILANPWEQELKSVAGRFGGLLRAIIATVDLYGLRKRHLGNHKWDIDRFFKGIAETTYPRRQLRATGSGC
jgi:hypothetical protein